LFAGEDITLWSAKNGTELKVLQTQPEITAIAFGPNGLLAAAGSGSIRLWDTRSMDPLPGLIPRQPYVRRMRFSPDGGLLAVAGPGRQVEVWDPSANALIASLPISEIAADLAFAPTGKTLAVAGSDEGVPLWEIVEPAARVRLGGFAQPPNTTAFGPDGTLAVASKDAPPRLWSPKDSSLTDRALSGVGAPSTLSFNPMNGKLVTFDSTTMFLRWSDPSSSTDADRQIRISDRGPRSTGGEPMSWSADGRIMAFARGDEVYLWSADSPESLRLIADPTDPNPQRGNNPRGGPPSPPIIGPPPEGTNPRRNGSGPNNRGGGGGGGGPGRSWRQVVLDPSGKRLYLVSLFPSELHVWNLAGSQAKEIPWKSPVDEVVGLALSDDGQMLALLDRSGFVTLVDPVSKEVITKLIPPSAGESQASVVAFAPGGSELAIGTRQGMIQVWTLGDDPSEPTLNLRLASHRGFVTTLVYDAKGQRLAAGGSDKTVDIWDLDQIRNELTTIGLGW
jgi:WD40 repeat protein